MNEYIKSLVGAKKLNISIQSDRWEFDENPCSVESE